MPNQTPSGRSAVRGPDGRFRKTPTAQELADDLGRIREQLGGGEALTQLSGEVAALADQVEQLETRLGTAVANLEAMIAEAVERAKARLEREIRLVDEQKVDRDGVLRALAESMAQAEQADLADAR